MWLTFRSSGLFLDLVDVSPPSLLQEFPGLSRLWSVSAPVELQVSMQPLGRLLVALLLPLVLVLTLTVRASPVEFQLAFQLLIHLTLVAMRRRSYRIESLRVAPAAHLRVDRFLSLHVLLLPFSTLPATWKTRAAPMEL